MPTSNFQLFKRIIVNHQYCGNYIIQLQMAFQEKIPPTSPRISQYLQESLSSYTQIQNQIMTPVRRTSMESANAINLMADEKMCISPIQTRIETQQTNGGLYQQQRTFINHHATSSNSLRSIIGTFNLSQTRSAVPEQRQEVSQAVLQEPQIKQSALKRSSIHHSDQTPPLKSSSERPHALETTQAQSSFDDSRHKSQGFQPFTADRESSFLKQNMLEIFNRPDLLNNQRGGIENIFSQFQQPSSVLSANNTPIKSLGHRPLDNIMFFTDQKKKSVQRNLLSFQKEVDETPRFCQDPYIPKNSGILYDTCPKGQVPLSLFSQSSEHKIEDVSYLQGAGAKRKLEDYDDEGFSTPYQVGKRRRLNPYEAACKSAQVVKSKAAQDYLKVSQVKRHVNTARKIDYPESESDDDENESNIHRKKRGLKILSVKVRELVQKLGQATYSNVANQLIDHLRNRKDILEMADENESEEEDEEYSEESPDKKGNQSGSKKEAEDNKGVEKWEKNVKRRVYDALNVLYAAGVLKKDGKYVSCNPEALEITKTSSEASIPLQEDVESYQDQLEASKGNYERRLTELRSLQQQIELHESLNNHNTAILGDSFKNYICYMHLVARNQKFEKDGQINPDTEKVHLPYILMTSEDTTDNEIDVTYGEGSRNIRLAVKKEIKCIGDVDTLMKLRFFRVDGGWLKQQLPTGTDGLLNMLSKETLKDIVIEGTD